MPEGSVSAVSSSITKLSDDLVEIQGRRIALEAALQQIQGARGQRARHRAPGGGRRARRSP